jgi:alpha-ribazole phosphatase/probable phosphoglycerate mutase
MRAAGTTLLLARHPHTAANERGGARLEGWTDAPLSDRGLAEASLLVGRLAGDGGVVAIYSSPLTRAWTVAERLAGRGIGVACDPDLREIGCGALDGWDVDRVRREHPLLWRRSQAQDDEHFRWPGGESRREFRARCLAAVLRIVRAHPGRRVVAVTHAGVVSQVVGSILGTSCARWDAFRPGNASITTVEFHGRERRVLGFDDRAHLGRCGGRRGRDRDTPAALRVHACVDNAAGRPY